MLHEAFLDSSILWAFVGPPQFEPHQATCVSIFNHPQVRRFASESVEREVRQTERRKSRLYSDLIAHLRAGRRPEEFPFEEFSRHIAERSLQLLRDLRGNEGVVEYLRRLGQLDGARIREAWSKIERPLVPSRNDAYLEDSLRAAVGFELQDAKVVSDYLFWAPTRDRARFLTADAGLLRQVRASLRAFLESREIRRPAVEDFMEPDRFLAVLQA